MKIVIVSGSQRPESQTCKVCTYIQNLLNRKDVDTHLLELGTQPLPLNSSTEARSQGGKDTIETYLSLLDGADGFVYASPEWSGAATPAIMNALSLAGSPLSHKPTMLVGVSASRGGSYPIAQMKAFGSKNNKTIFVPDHIIVHNVTDVLESETSLFYL
jgi:NAD(P)H-dependent FMN reductase